MNRENASDNASPSNSSSEFFHERKRHKVFSLPKSSSKEHSIVGPFFPKSGLPLQSQVSDEPVRVLCNLDDAQDTNTVVASFIAADEVARAILLIHINEIIDKFDTSSAALDTVRELVILGRIPVWDTFLRITEKLLKAIKDSILLQTTALQGLAVVLNSCPDEIDMKGKEGFYSDILALLQTRLDNARTKKNEDELIPLLYAIIALLSAMQYREVGKLDSDRIFNPLKTSLARLESHKNTTVSFLTSYANQSLFHVRNNESLEKSIFRHGLLAIRIAVDIASGIKNVDLGKFESAFQSIMKMNDFSIKASWYTDLILLDSTVYVQDWTKFEKLVLMSNLKSKERFLQGACLRLEQIAGTQPSQDVRDGAIKFLRYILANSSNNGQHIAHAALGRLGVCHCEIHSDSDIQQRTVSTTCSCTARKNVQNDLPAIWDLSWHSESAATLLKIVQRERRSHMKVEDTATNVVEMRGDLSKLVNNAISSCSLDEVRHALAAYYKDVLKVLRVSGDELDLDSCYVNLAIVEASSHQRREKGDLESKARAFQRMPSCGESTYADIDLPIPLEQLFDKRRLRNGNMADPKRILIYGRAGVGKSTLCKKIVHLFQAGKWRDKFDAILWLPLRHIKDCNFHTISDMLSKWYFASQLQSVKLSHTLQNSRVLFILDGLDEIVTTLRTNRNLMEFFKVLLQQEHVLITSRPSGVDKSILPGIDLEMETVGFSVQNVKDYLSIVLPPDHVQSVQKFIDQTPAVQGLVNIPVQLDVICFSWDSLPTNVEEITITRLYEAMVCKLCRKDVFKLQRKSGEELLSEYDIDKLHPREIYTLIDSELEYLSYLAFEGLKDNHRIEFDEQWMCDIFMDLNHKRSHRGSPSSVLLVNRLKEMSFLHSAEMDLNVNVRNFQGHWHFLHLTFQEYFAATWIVRRLQDSLSDGAGDSLLTIKEFVSKEKYNPRYEILWWMVAGQLKGSALVSFFDILQGAPLDLIGGYHHHLLAACLKEGRSELGKVDPGRVESLENQLIEWLQFERFCFDRYGRRNRRGILGTMAYISEELIIRSIAQSEGSSEYLIQTLEGRTTITPSAMQILVNALQDKDKDTRCLAAVALVYQPTLSDSVLQALIGVLLEENPFAMYLAFFASGKRSTFSDSVLQALIGALRHGNEKVRNVAALVLQFQLTLTGSALQALIDALKDENEKVRDSAVKALGNQSSLSDSALQALIGALQDENEDVRYSVASALGKQSTLPDSALKALISALHDKDWHVGKAAASALGKQSKLPDLALQALISALQDRHVSYSAISALGKQSPLSDLALQALIGALHHENKRVRQSAARALGKQSNLPDSALQVLIGALKDVSYSTDESYNIQGLLDSITLSFTSVYDEDEDIRYPAASAVGVQSPLTASALQALIGALQDKDWNVRYSAASALGNRSPLPDSALQALIGVLQQDRVSNVRQAAAKALGNQPTLSDSVLQALISLLPLEELDIGMSAFFALFRQSNLPNLAIQSLVGLLEYDHDNSNMLSILGSCAGSAFMAIPNLAQSSIETLYTSFLVRYGSQNSASLWVQDNQMFFYTAQGFDKVDGLSVEDVEKVVTAFNNVKRVFLNNN
ncbi:hypothetical protein BGZ46_008321 [Entomortierella lignicola]|nr:hypothetical protein BGZ46_008321 [Entomortierella lignicola]